MSSTDNTGGRQVRFGMMRVYIKKLEAELRGAPEVYNENVDTSLKSKYGFRVESKRFENLAGAPLPLFHEVTIIAELEVPFNDKGSMRFHVEQAAMIDVDGLGENELEPFLNIDCAHMLYPYLRETVDSLAIRATVPPLFLPPINFAEIYKHKQKQAEEGTEGGQAQDNKDTEIENLKKQLAMLQAGKDLEKKKPAAKKKNQRQKG